MMRITRLFMGCLLLICIVIPACEKNETVCEPSTQLFVERFRQGAFPSESYSKCTDATLEQQNPDSNFGSTTNLLVGNYTATGLHSVIRFEIAGMLPASAVIEGAFLTLFCFDLMGLLACEARPLAADWIEAEVTWTNRTAFYTWNSLGGDYTQEVVGTVTELQQFTAIDIGLSTALIKKWIQRPSENLGIILIPESGTPENGYTAFLSSEYSNIDLRPMLTVVYSIQ